MELNEQLKFNDEMFKIASAKTEITILIYDVKSKQLKFVNKGAFDFDVPPVIENAPKEVMKFVPNQRESRMQMENVFKSLGHDETNGSFYITLQFDEEIRYFHIRVSNLFSESGKIAQCVGLMKDVTEEMQLRSEVKFRETLLSNTIGFMEIDLDEDYILRSSENMINVVNKTVRFTDYMEHMLETSVLPEYREYIRQHLSKEMLCKAFERGVQDSISEFQCYDGDGGSLWVECEVHLERDRELGHIRSYHIMRDIDDKKQEELKLREEADIDHLTGLYNRRSGSDKINKILTDTNWKGNETYACMIIDLDNFKVLNDTLGHQMGDKALRDVGEILRRHFRPYDVVCRLGGDEFLIFLSNIPEEVIDRNISSLLKKMYLEYSDGNNRVQISASIGISLAPVHGTELKELYRKADLALYEAKHQGKAGYQVYEG